MFDITPFLRHGVNIGIATLIKSVPGGSVAFASGCEALELAAKMIQVLVPRLKDGDLSDEDADAIVEGFKGTVPPETFALALKIVKSSMDRVVGSL